MRTSIDTSGRVVVPKRIRERLHLLNGGEVDIRERDGVIEIIPAPAKVELIDEGGKPVAVPTDQVVPLTDDDVRAAIEDLRR
ncbi:MAG: antitoxin [Acidobacteria bacterium]|nr:MAG: antitoxin [Acidobacteriota bacterium]